MTDPKNVEIYCLRYNMRKAIQQIPCHYLLNNFHQYQSKKAQFPCYFWHTKWWSGACALIAAVVMNIKQH